MSKTYIPVVLRRLVFKRARDICEYCLIPATLNHKKSYHIDHIISEKHGGETVSNNLALACSGCNIIKGSDIGSLLPGRKEVIALFNPRLDDWHQHFSLQTNGKLIAHSDQAKVTINLLNLNDESFTVLRSALLEVGIGILPKRRVL